MEKEFLEAIKKINFDALYNLICNDYEGYDSVYKSDHERPNLLSYRAYKKDDEEIKDVLWALAQEKGIKTSLYEQSKSENSFRHIAIGKSMSRNNEGRLYISPNDKQLYPMIKDLIRFSYRNNTPIYFKYTRKNRRDKIIIYLKELTQMDDVIQVLKDISIKHPEYFENMDTPAIWINETDVSGVYFSPESLVKHLNGTRFESTGILMSYALYEIENLMNFFCGCHGNITLKDFSKNSLMNIFQQCVIRTFLRYGLISPVTKDGIKQQVYPPNKIGEQINYIIEYDRERKTLTEGRKIDGNTFRFFEIPFSRRDEYFNKPLKEIDKLYNYEEDYNLHVYKNLYERRSDKNVKN